MGVADGEDGGCACSGGTKTGGSGSIGGGGGGGGGGGDAASNGPATRQLSNEAAGNNSNGMPPAQALTSAASVALTEWLGNLGLGAYESRLVSQGFDSLEAMSTATESDLEAMGFKKGHLRLLLARAPSAVASFGSGTGGGDGRDSRISVDVSAAAGPVGLARSESTVSTAATIGYNVGNNGFERAKKTVRIATRKIDGQEEGEEEEEEGRYCDASALQPSRTLSNSTSNGEGRGDGGGDGFKELKPEEVDIDHVIGEGSFGVVRRARWRGMDVAVKELKTSIASAAAAAAASAAAGGGGATAGAGVSAAVGGGRGGTFKPRDADDLMGGQEEMRHEARMLAKGGWVGALGDRRPVCVLCSTGSERIPLPVDAGHSQLSYRPVPTRSSDIISDANVEGFMREGSVFACLVHDACTWLSLWDSDMESGAYPAFVSSSGPQHPSAYTLSPKSFLTATSSRV